MPVADDRERRLEHTALMAEVRSTIEGALDPIRIDLRQVRDAITGNGLGVHHGLVGLVDELRDRDTALTDEMKETGKRVGSLEDKWDRAKWLLVGASLGTGGVAGGVAALVAKAIGG